MQQRSPIIKGCGAPSPARPSRPPQPSAPAPGPGPASRARAAPPAPPRPAPLAAPRALPRWSRCCARKRHATPPGLLSAQIAQRKQTGTGRQAGEMLVVRKGPGARRVRGKASGRGRAAGLALREEVLLAARGAGLGGGPAAATYSGGPGDAPAGGATGLPFVRPPLPSPPPPPRPAARPYARSRRPSERPWLAAGPAGPGARGRLLASVFSSGFGGTASRPADAGCRDLLGVRPANLSPRSPRPPRLGPSVGSRPPTPAGSGRLAAPFVDAFGALGVDAGMTV